MTGFLCAECIGHRYLSQLRKSGSDDVTSTTQTEIAPCGRKVEAKLGDTHARVRRIGNVVFAIVGGEDNLIFCPLGIGGAWNKEIISISTANQNARNNHIQIG